MWEKVSWTEKTNSSFQCEPQMERHQGQMELFLTRAAHAASSSEGIAAKNVLQQQGFLTHIRTHFFKQRFIISCVFQ